MTAVQQITILPKDENVRLDRWFRRYYPDLKNGTLQRLLRNKNIRVNEARAASSQKLQVGDVVRIPPLEVSLKAAAAPRALSQEDIDFMRSLVIFKDKDLIAINKPCGLAVQGGTKTERHVDGLLDALRFEADEKPRLVHRLDKDTSGVLLLARSAAVAAALSKSFSDRSAQKIYWAVVVGTPKIETGKINAPLLKVAAPQGREQVVVDYEKGQRAVTLYRTIDSLGKKAAWLEMSPLTGRTHQLRVHATLLKTPMVGDFKYAGETDVTLGLAGSKKMHLHARALRIKHPVQKKVVEIFADLPPHMQETFSFLGFDPKESSRPFDFFYKEDL